MAQVADRRVLAAVRFMDYATGAPVTGPLVVTGTDSRWIRNASGLWVLTQAPGLEAHTTAFEAAPTTPAAKSVSVTAVVTDPARAYMTRAFNVPVPRTGTELFTPVDVFLPPSPAAHLRRTWAAVRASARLVPDAQHPAGTPVEGALVRLQVDGEVRCMSLTDVRGEALLIGHGIPMFSAGEDDEIVESSLQHVVVAVLDPAATDPDTGRRSSVANPDDLWRRRAALRRKFFTNVPLSPGEERHLTVDFARS